MNQAAPLTEQEMKRPLLHIPTNTRFYVQYEAGGMYALESIAREERYATAAQLRDGNQWRFA